MKNSTSSAVPADGTLLGIELGGTHTVALLASRDGQLLGRAESGPANLRLRTDAELVAHFQAVKESLGVPSAVGVGAAGARGADDARRVCRLLAQVWPGIPSRAGHDLESALAAASVEGAPEPNARVIVLAGTGSCTYGRNRAGGVAKVGGWGHLLGDRGSGYDIGFAALRRIIEDHDRQGEWSELAVRILRALQLGDPEELIAWVQQATKTDIAALATQVFATAPRSRDARELLAHAAQAIADDAAVCARQLGCRRRAVEFVFAGGVFTRQESQFKRVADRIRAQRPGMRDHFQVLHRESAWGAVALAREALEHRSTAAVKTVEKGRRPLLKTAKSADGRIEVILPVATDVSPTERRNPRSMTLDRLSVEKAVGVMIDEDATIASAIRPHGKSIARLVRLVARALSAGGRLIYVGAGTSGRLGVLDASECPPTFRTPPEWVQGIIAGGVQALWLSVEGAEDDVEGGARAVAFRKVGEHDVVVGIAASGRTPYVWGALAEARRRGAATALVCCNPHLRFPSGSKPDVVIDPDVGPEVLTGSTRLKSGTATKLILNMVTTLAMTQLGKVVSNLMVDLNPSNTKLRDRAIRIVQEITGCERAVAQLALEAAGWVVKDALEAVRRGRGS